jgi:ribosome maturation factor RimP
MTEDFVKAKLSGILNNDFFIVDVKVNERNDKINVYLDRFSGGLTLADCERIHRELYPEIELIKDNFELVVSSPGLTKPLKVWQQYYKNIGKKIKITTNAGEFFEAEIISADKEKVILRKINDFTPVEFQYNQIKKAVLKIF